MTTSYTIQPIGYIESPLVEPTSAPKQGFEGVRGAWLVFHPDVSAGIRDLALGAEVFVLTWLHRARRDVLAVHPRDAPTTPRRASSAPAPPIAPTRSGCTACRSRPSTDSACGCAIWRRSTGRPLWM